MCSLIIDKYIKRPYHLPNIFLTEFVENYDIVNFRKKNKNSYNLLCAL